MVDLLKSRNIKFQDGRIHWIDGARDARKTVIVNRSKFVNHSRTWSLPRQFGSFKRRILKHIGKNGERMENCHELGAQSESIAEEAPVLYRSQRIAERRNQRTLAHLDTLDTQRLQHLYFKHFTIRYMNSRWDEEGVYRHAKAGNAREFLQTQIERVNFPIPSILMNDGSEFLGRFDLTGADTCIHTFDLPPWSPCLNFHVEWIQRTRSDAM